MKMRTVLSVAAACGTLLLSGAAFSGGSSTSDNQMVDYDDQTGELWAIPSGGSTTTYQHDPKTQQLQANLSQYQPPDPCLPLAEVWNILASQQHGHGHGDDCHDGSSGAFGALLTVMAAHGCKATITATSGAPKPIIQITPTAQ
jgi:hypothetical protein